MQTKNNVLTKEEEFHNHWAKEINLKDLCVLEAFEGPVSPEYHHAINLLGNIKGKKILNPGCGAGEETIYMALKGAKINAFDISQGMIDVAKKLAGKFRVEKSVILEKMDAEKEKYPDNTFDIIFGNSILHHININKSAKEFHRVLKNGGKAVFIEPLAYNPIINRYRTMAKEVRTKDEHPLTYRDIKEFNKYFKEVKHQEFQFTTLLIFCYFYLFERVNPNQDRYWKKIIRDGKKYTFVFKVLYRLDKIILALFPYLKRYCWVTVIEAIK